MSQSIAAGKIQVLIGTDYQDWSACYSEFTAGLSERNDSGILFTTGKLQLAVTADAPTSMNARTGSGRARFFKGQQVILNYDFGGGTWTRHPHGFLYILKPPLPPSFENPYLELELGCSLQYANKPQPAKTLSRADILQLEIEAGQGFQRGEGILAALKQAGIQRVGALASVVAAIGAGGGTDEIKDDLAKNEETNWIEVAGELAYGAEQYLYQDGYGVIQGCSIALSTAIAPIATIEIGKDEISYEAVDGGEVPVDSVVYGGTSSEAVPSPPSNVFEFKVRDAAVAVDPDAGSGQVELRNTTVREDVSGTTIVFSERSDSARGALAPAVFPKDFGMDLDVDRVTTRKYDFDGKLLSELLSESRLYPVGLSDYFGKLSKAEQAAAKFQRVTVKESETLIDYAPYSQIVKSVKKTDRETIAAICPDEKHLSPTSLRVCRIETTSWDSVRAGEWRKSELLLESFTRVQSGASYADATTPAARISAKLALVPRYSRIIPSNAGKNQPPATERLPAKEEIKKKEYRVEIKVGSDKDFKGDPKDKSLGRGVRDETQLARLAQIEGVMLLGRSQGAQIQLPILAAFLTDTIPLKNLVVVDSEVSSLGVRQNLILYQMDGREFSHEAEKAVLTASLIWLGTQEGAWQPTTPIPPTYNPAAIVPPYSEVQTFGNDTDPRDLAILPPPILTALRLYPGLGLGSVSVDNLPFPFASTPLVLACGLGLSASLDLGSALSALTGLGLSIDLLPLTPGLIPLPTISITQYALGLGGTVLPVPLTLQAEGGLGLGIGDLNTRLLDAPLSPLEIGLGLSMADFSFFLMSPMVNISIAEYALGLGQTVTPVPLNQSTEPSLGLGMPAFRLRSLGEFFPSGSPPDQQGIFYFWGTNFGDAASWSNPTSWGASLSFSSTAAGSAVNTTDRATNTNNATNNTASSWLQLDCGVSRSICPTGYYLQHDGSGGNFLRDWKLQGSNNGSTWTDLDARTGDTSLSNPAQFAQFTATGTTFWRYLRILQTGLNSSGTNTLTLSEWELYGWFKY